MKRTLAVLALMALLAPWSPATQADDERGWRGHGPGMGYGMGPGSSIGPGPGMGGGMGYPSGGGPGMGGSPHMGALLEQLAPEKREQLRAFHFGMQRQRIARQADFQQAQLTLAEALATFPLDRNRAQDAYAAVHKAERALFDLHLTAVAQMQQILGKELWERMHHGMPMGAGYGPGYGSGMGPGGGNPGGNPGQGGGPGMMGPRR